MSGRKWDGFRSNFADTGSWMSRHAWPMLGRNPKMKSTKLAQAPTTRVFQGLPPLRSCVKIVAWLPAIIFHDSAMSCSNIMKILLCPKVAGWKIHIPGTGVPRCTNGRLKVGRRNTLRCEVFPENAAEMVHMFLILETRNLRRQRCSQKHKLFPHLSMI